MQYGLRLFSRKNTDAASRPRTGGAVRNTGTFVPAPPDKAEADPLKALFQQQRYSVILSRQEEWSKRQEATRSAGRHRNGSKKQMALVPAGRATLPQTLTDAAGAPETEVEVEPSSSTSTR